MRLLGRESPLRNMSQAFIAAVIILACGLTAFVNPYGHQFSIGAQRELPWRTTIELSYVGSRTRQEQNRWGGFNEPPLSLQDAALDLVFAQQIRERAAR